MIKKEIFVVETSKSASIKGDCIKFYNFKGNFLRSYQWKTENIFRLTGGRKVTLIKGFTYPVAAAQKSKIAKKTILLLLQITSKSFLKRDKKGLI